MKHPATATRIAKTAALAALAVAAMTTAAQAYPMYDDGFNNGCVQCHTGFQGGPSAPLHGQHVLNLQITGNGDVSLCNVCHKNGGGDTPVYTMGSNQPGTVGYGCAGCHGQDFGQTASTSPFTGRAKATGKGLRLVHTAAGVMECNGCHSGTEPVAVLDENSKPPYYTMGVSKLADPCLSTQEDLSYDMDSLGLDNDGNGTRDYPGDPNCIAPTTTTSTTSTTTTTLPATCSPAPAVGCTVAASAKLQINEKTAGKEKLKADLGKLVPVTTQADFGDPTVGGGTTYALCVYDATNALVVSYEVQRAGQICVDKPCWQDSKGTGWKFADGDEFSDGIAKMSMSGGDAGKGKIKVQGNNSSGTLPTGIAALLSGDTSATVQLISHDADCFTATLPTVSKNDGTVFQAKAP